MAAPGPKLKVLVCGSRKFANVFTVSLAINARIKALPDGTEIIHGDAQGADNMAASAAMLHGHKVTAHPADWKTHGKRAGILRNIQMLDQRPDLVIAFWDGQSRGTAHTIGEARKRGIPTEVIQP